MDSLYFSALQSFVALARTTRMQEATRQLGVSRQTIMRHLNYLYELREGPLLKLDGHSYSPTENGAEFLTGAEKLLEQASVLAGEHGLHVETVDGLERVRFSNELGQDFRSQQYPLWRIKDIGTPTIQRAFKAWLEADFDINHPKIVDLMPFLSVFREQEYGWVCTHVGTESAYARSFGKDWAMSASGSLHSASGSLHSESPSGKSYQLFASRSYKSALHSGCCYFDHNYLDAGSDHDWPFQYVMYQRMLLPLMLPDRTPILGSFSIITPDVEFVDFQPSSNVAIQDDLVMDFQKISSE